MNKTLLWIYIGFVFVKVVLSLFVSSPTIFSDEYYYFKMAQSIAYDGSIRVHGQSFYTYPPFYPLLLSLVSHFDNISFVYILVKILNAFLSTLLVFPAYLLARIFFSEKQSLFFATFTNLLPSHFSFTYYVMSENLFYPLFLFSLYFMYKALHEHKLSFHLLAGLFTSLAILTRMLGASLVVIYGVTQFFLLLKEKGIQRKIKEMFFYGLPLLFIILLWFIPFFILRGVSATEVLGPYAKMTNLHVNSFLSFIFWGVSYVGYFIIASLFVFFPLLLRKVSTEKKYFLLSLLTIISSLILILIVAKYASNASIKGGLPWLTGRPIGRYLDFVLPLIFLQGMVYLEHSSVKRITLSFRPLIPLFLFAFYFNIFYKLFPVNNMSVSWVGVVKYFYDHVIHHSTSFDPVISLSSLIFVTFLLLALFFIFERIFSLLSLRTFFRLCFAIFVVLNILNVALISYSSQRWYHNEHTQLGFQLNDFLPPDALVLVDEQSCVGNDLRQEHTLCNKKKDTTLFGFWMRQRLRIGTLSDVPDADYFVTTTRLDLLDPVLFTPSGTFVYKVTPQFRAISI